MTGKADPEKPAGKTVRPANKRGVARLAAVQALYQMDVGGAPLTSVVSEFTAFRLGKEIDGAQYREADEQWFKQILAGVVEDQKFLDPYIHTALAEDWPLKRIDSLLRAILRSGSYELLRRKDVPAKVIISEYIDVTKPSSMMMSGLVNGVLDRLAHELRSGELEEKKTDGAS